MSSVVHRKLMVLNWQQWVEMTAVGETSGGFSVYVHDILECSARWSTVQFGNVFVVKHFIRSNLFMHVHQAFG